MNALKALGASPPATTPAAPADEAIDGAAPGFGAELDAAVDQDSREEAPVADPTPVQPGIPAPQPTPVAQGVAATSTVDAAGDAGWPPPGLAALFPTAATPLPAAPASTADAPMPRGPLATASTAPAETTPTALAAAAPMPPEAMPPVSAPMLARATPQPAQDRVAPGLVLPAITPTTSALAAPTAPLPATPTALAASPAIAAAQALAAATQQAGPGLALPGLRERSAREAVDGLAALDDGLDITPLDSASPWSSAPLAPLPRLDLAAAFPAPLVLHQPRAAEDLGARLGWVANQQGGEATVRLSPDGLGTLEIRLRLDGDRVELGLHATQADTRQALEQSLPRLRELLAQQGLQLGHADVGQRQAQGSGEGHDGRRDAPRRDEGPGGAARGLEARGPITAGVATIRLPRGDGRLDLYA